MRQLWRVLRWALYLYVSVHAVVWVIYANPGMLFAYSHQADGLTLHSVEPIDPEHADLVLTRVAKTLDASPLGGLKTSPSAYDTGNTWRTPLFFASVRQAGGVTYYPFSTRNAYLAGMDLANDVLVKGPFRMTPPRSLSYYLVHEFTHLRIGELTGPIAYHLLPRWIMEGICDVVALGVMDKAQIQNILDWQGTDLALMETYGSYPIERALVSFAELDLGLSPSDLISDPITRAEILERATAKSKAGEL